MTKQQLVKQKEMLKKDLDWVSEELKIIVVIAKYLADGSVTAKNQDRICLHLARKINYLLGKIMLQDRILKELKEVCGDA